MNRGSSLALVLVVAAVLCGARTAAGQDLDALEDQHTASIGAGRYAESERIARRGLAIATQQQSDISVAGYSDRLAQSLYMLSRYDEAEPYYKRALAIYEQTLGPDDMSVAGICNNLAVLYKEQGRFADAEPLYTRNLNILEKTVGQNHPDYALGLNNLGVFQMQRGLSSKAEALLERALSIYGAQRESKPADIARSLSSVAFLRRSQGRYAEAERFEKGALAIRVQSLGPQHTDVASSLLSLGQIYQDQVRYNEALAFLENALAIYEQSDLGQDDWAKCLRQLAMLSSVIDHHAEAEKQARRAIEVMGKVRGADSLPMAPAYLTMANILARQKRFAEAEPFVERAQAINARFFGADAPEAAYSTLTHARLEFELGRIEKAKALVDRAIGEATRAGLEKGLLAELLDLRATIAWKEGRRNDAIADLRAALKFADDQRVTLSGGEVDRAASFSKYNRFYERMVQWQVELGNVGLALDALERSRARSLIDEMNLAGVDLQRGRSAEDRMQIERDGAAFRESVVRAEKKLQAATADPARKAERQRLADELRDAKDRLYQFNRNLRTISPIYRDLLNRGSDPLPLDQIQRQLCGNAGLLLIYLFGKDGGNVIVIGPDKARVVPLQLEAADAKALGSTPGPLTAERLQAILMGSKESSIIARLANPGLASPTQALGVLWRVLIPQSDRDHLVDGTIKRLIVVPDGLLAFLPFEALVVDPQDDDPGYLLDSGPPITYAPSATILMSLASRAGTPSVANRDPVLALGDPAYPQWNGGAAPEPGSGKSLQRFALAGGALPRLPNSGQEATWVADAFNKVGIKAGKFIGPNATEAGVRYWAPGRKLLHLACHGLTDQTLGNFYGALALTPGPNPDADPSNDGFLMLPEIYGLDLKGCELAILSACQTNFGPQQSGEGTWSLSRGFLVAGARRVVASNWVVDDLAAATLISGFCDGLASDEKAGKVVDYAGDLQKAKRQVRARNEWKAPYYWASLVQVGPP